MTIKHLLRYAGLWIAAAELMLLISCHPADLPVVSIPVMLAESEGLTHEGTNVYMAAPGERVTFPIELDEGYLIESVNGGAYYADGQIILDAAYYPTTLIAQTRPAGQYVFSLQNDRSNGSVTYSHNGGLYLEGTEITVQTFPAHGKAFLGYSIGKPLAQGGEIVSHDTVYSFQLDNHTELITNYASDNFSLTYITDEGTARLNAIADKIRSAGGIILLSFAPANRNAVIGIWEDKTRQQEYVSVLDQKLNYPRITELPDMLLPGNLFHNSDYHVSTEGAKLRTQMLADDLLSYLHSTEN